MTRAERITLTLAYLAAVVVLLLDLMVWRPN
jgi:hypothetical protein